MWFRCLLILAATAQWILLGWLAGHRSDHPAILGRWSLGYAGVLAVLLVAAIASSCATRGAPYRALHSRRRRIVMLFGSLVISAVLAEFAVRTIEPLGLSYYEASTRYHLDKVADPELFYRHRSSFRAEYAGVEYAFNELGFRGESLVPKVAGEFRILFVGDSVTLGWGVAATDSFVQRVAGLLGAGDREVRAINGGCGSYNSAQELAFTQRYVPALAPDLVVLTYVENDAEAHPGTFDPRARVALAGKSPPEQLRLLAGGSWVYRLFEHVLLHGGDQHSAFAVRGADWNRSFEAVGAMARTCREHGVAFAVVVWRLESSPFSDSILAQVREVGRSEGFPVGDAAEAFAGEAVSDLVISPIDTHPNRAAHERLAGYLAQFLREHRLDR